MKRLNRLRRFGFTREMVKETNLPIKNFIYPLFATHGKNIKKPIASMPGCFHFSADKLVEEVKEVKKLKIPAIILFGIPRHKDESASGAYAENGIIQTAIRAIKKQIKDIVVITDVCLCEYTSHGHCGVFTEDAHKRKKIADRGGVPIDLEKTLEILTKTAISHADAGADMIAPSDMMDGRVLAVRKGLNSSGYEDIPIMAYSAKFASSFYGPFRDAAESTPKFGNRKSYQMDFSNRREAIRELLTDIEEGADIIMVKPALAYLDIIREIREKTLVPIAAYNVSGEYSMVKAASQRGWIDEKKAVFEILTSIKRAGADLILTYHAKDIARWLNK